MLAGNVMFSTFNVMLYDTIIIDKFQSNDSECQSNRAEAVHTSLQCQ